MGLMMEILIWIGGLLLGESHAREGENIIWSSNYFELMLKLLKSKKSVVGMVMVRDEDDQMWTLKYLK